MNLLFLLNGIFGLAIFLFLLIRFFIDRDKKSAAGIMKYLITIGFLYLVTSLLSIFWLVDYLEYSLRDYTSIYVIVILIQNLIFFKVILLYSKNKKLYYLLGLYLLSVPLMIIFTHSAMILFLIVSFLFSILVFLDFAFRDDIYSRVGYLGIFYSVVSLILSLMTIIGIGDIYLFSIISMAIFASLIYLFVKDIENYSIIPAKAKQNSKSYLFKLLEHLIFIIIITNFVFIGTIAVHEAGHFTASTLMECDYQKIVFEGGLFHTEVLCKDSSVTQFVTFGGILSPLLIAGLLFLIGGKFMREIAYLMSGFNLLAISRDLGAIGVSQNISLISIIIGAVLLIFGVFNLAKSKTEDEIYRDFSYDFSGGFGKE